VKRVGVVGSMVWDTIHGRDPVQPPVEEWGGISYALSAFDAALADDWQVVPLIKVGRDLASRARQFLGGLRHVAPGARFIEVPEPNNRVTLRYESADRRCELLSGGVPAWTWSELGPLVQDLDALYVNFISGFEMALPTAQAMARAFPGPIYTDLHSLFLGVATDGLRVPRPLPEAPGWFGCSQWIQLNEDEFALLGPDPLAVTASVLSAGCRGLIVTLGPRGAVYFDRPDPALPIATERVSLELAGAATLAGVTGEGGGDPTGCGDVFGAVTFSHLLRGTPLAAAIREGVRLATRNVSYRGATGLRDHLLGHLATI